MSREDVLLKEYELCQTETDKNSVNYWTISGIFIGISTALLAAIAAGLTSNNINKWMIFILVLIFGLAIFSFHLLLYKLLKRINFLNRIDFQRMREIERELRMRKSGLVHGLDEWETIPLSYRRSILGAWPDISDTDKELYARRLKNELPNYLIAPIVGREVIPWFLIINSILWGIMILLSFSIATIDSIIYMVKLLTSL